MIVRGNFEDGIASKNDIKIKSGSIEVTAKDDAIRGTVTARQAVWPH